MLTVTAGNLCLQPIILGFETGGVRVSRRTLSGDTLWSWLWQVLPWFARITVSLNSSVKMRMSGTRLLKTAAVRPSPPRMKKFWGTVKNPWERTTAGSLATGGESRGIMQVETVPRQIDYTPRRLLFSLYISLSLWVLRFHSTFENVAVVRTFTG